MRWPRTSLLTTRGTMKVLSLNSVRIVAMAFARRDLLKRISQLNNAICTPTLFAADTVISDRLHRALVTFDRWKKFTNFLLLGIPKSAAGGIQRFFHATAFAAFTKRHSPLDFMQSQGRTLRYSCLNRWHLLAPVHV